MEVLSCFESYCDNCSKCEPKVTHGFGRTQNGNRSNTIRVYCEHEGLCNQIAKDLKGRLIKNVNN